jgi:hypothetical protein
VAARVVLSSAASRWRGGCQLELNKGGLILHFFKYQPLDLIHEDILDLDIDEFQSFFQSFPQFDV